VFWLLGRVGWGVLLALGLFILVNQVFEVSRGLSDFCQDYVAAQRLTQGVPVYLPLHCWKNSGIIYWPAPFEYDAHPPPSILFIWPLSLLSMVQAATLWGLLSLAAYLASGILLLHALGWRSLRSLALFILGSALWQPFTYAEAQQNSAQVLLLLLVGAWLLERRGRVGWAGALIGLAGLLKVWPAVLLVLAVLQRQWRLFWSGAATLLGGTLLTMLILGPGAYAAYLGPVRDTELYWIPTEGNVSLVSAVVRPFTGYRDPPLFLPPVMRSLSLSQAALLGQALGGLLLLTALIFLWRCWQRAQHEAVATLSLGLLVTVLLLAFPLTWLWGLMLLLLPLTTMLLALRQVDRPPGWWFLLLGVSLLSLIEPGLVFFIPQRLLQSQTPGVAQLGTLLYALPTAGLLLFAGVQGWLLWRASAAAPKKQAIAGQGHLASEGAEGA
jgi:hypothetical protein